VVANKNCCSNISSRVFTAMEIDGWAICNCLEASAILCFDNGNKVFELLQVKWGMGHLIFILREIS
jgi:hypothetical protein